MKRQVFLYMRMLFLLFFIFIFDINLVAAQNTKNEKTINLHLALPFHVLDELTRKDAQFAMDMWTKEIVRIVKKQTNIHFIVTSDFLENDYTQTNLSLSKKFDLIILGALDFFDYNFDKYWESVALTTVKGHFPEEYLVLARKDRNYKDIRDLQSKKIALSKNQDERIIEYWLNYLLQKKHFGSADDFFKSQTFVTKDSKAIVSVFFNKADACVVNYNQFQTMVQLNPQIGQDLVVIAQSPAFARGMFCLKKTLDEKIKQIITNAALDLNKSQRGKQILAFFGQSSMIPSKPEYLETLRELVQNSKALAKKRQQ